MNIVLDTNVLVSALLSPFQAPGRILDLVLAGKVRLAYDDRILAEYRAVLLRPKFGFDPRHIEELLDECVGAGQAVLAPQTPLITGNSRHYPPDRCAGILVLPPATFLTQWQQQEAS